MGQLAAEVTYPDLMINSSTLNNGIRVITEKVTHVESVALGIWVGSGAKHEKPGEYGLSHFMEHMMFKGTPRRTARQIADDVANVGGQINAATDREYTTYYMKVLKEYTPLAVDVLSDMLANSTFDSEELTREKDVISEEIRRHEDMPEDRVHDILAEITWGGHALGHPVLGREADVRACTSDFLLEFRRTHYLPQKIVVSAAGNFDHNELVNLLNDCPLASFESSADLDTFEPVKHNAQQKVVTKDTEAAYFCIGAPGFAELDDRKFILAVMDAILGGGMSSRLFQEVREKRGLAYDIGSYRISYREGGLFAVYGGTGVSTLGEVMEIIYKELEKLRNSPVEEQEFQRALTQIRVGLLLAQESMGSRMARLGKSVLDYDRYISIEEVIDKLMQVTPESVRQMAGEMLKEENLSVAVIGPVEDLQAVSVN